MEKDIVVEGADNHMINPQKMAKKKMLYDYNVQCEVCGGYKNGVLKSTSSRCTCEGNMTPEVMEKFCEEETPEREIARLELEIKQKQERIEELKKPKVLSCGYCGGNAEDDNYALHRHKYVCKGCGITGPFASTELGALNAWNKLMSKVIGESDPVCVKSNFTDHDRHTTYIMCPHCKNPLEVKYAPLPEARVVDVDGEKFIEFVMRTKAQKGLYFGQIVFSENGKERYQTIQQTATAEFGSVLELVTR